MADLTEIQSSQSVKIAGRDELYQADVIQEDGLNKLIVKSSIVPVSLGNLFFLKAENGGSSDMSVNGSGTPVTFSISSDPTDDLVVTEMRFSCFDNGIKIDNFLAQNSALTNGIDIDVTSGGVSFSFLPITTTAEFESNFSFGLGGRFNLIVGSGSDFCSSTFSPSNPFVLEAGTSDSIDVTINDNLNNVGSIELIAFGFKD